MAYCNNCSVGGEIISGLSGMYNVNAHGDIGAHYNSVMNIDLPRYTARFYHASEQEMMSEVRYDKLDVKYDKGLMNMREASKGIPIEAYIPRPIMFDGTISASPSVIIREPEVVPKRDVVEEILKAQAEVVGKNQKVMIRVTEREEEIYMRRRSRKVEIFKKKEE